MSTSKLQTAAKYDFVTLVGRPSVLVMLTALLGVAYGFSLAYSVSPLLLVAAPLAIVVVALAIAKPELAAVILLGITWGYISEIANEYHGVPSLSKPLVALLLLTLIIRRFTGRRVSFVYDTSIWWMASYFLIICLGLWYAQAPDRTLLLVIDFAKDLILFLVLINLISSIRLFEYSIWVLLAVGALLGTVTLLQEVTQNYDSTYGGLARPKIDAQIADGFQNRPRAGGPTREPLAFAQQMLVLVPIGLWGMLHGRSFPFRAFAAFSVAVCLVAVGLSFSRSSYVALAVALALYALHLRLKPRYLLLMLTLVGGLLWAAPPEFTARFSTLTELLPSDPGVNPEASGFNSEASYRMRFVQLQMAANMFADHPLVGVGGWNFVVLYPEYIRQSGSTTSTSFGPPHNYFLEIMAEHGLLGLFAVGGILVVAATRLRRAQHLFATTENRRMAELAVALQIAFIGYLISATFLHGLYSRFLWLQVSLAVAFALIARQQGGIITVSSSTICPNTDNMPHIRNTA